MDFEQKEIDFAERLKLVMKEKKLTRYRVAKELKISASTVANYLERRTKPDYTKLEAISRLLEVNRKWLMDGEGEKERKSVMWSSEDDNDGLSVSENGVAIQAFMRIIEKQTESIKEKDQQIIKLIETFDKIVTKMDDIIHTLKDK